VFSEGAPIPIARNAFGYTVDHGIFSTRSEAIEEGHIRSGRSGAIARVCAVAAAHTKGLPTAVVGETGIACSRLLSAWMKFRMLIERNLVGGVLPAEDVSTTSAMVSTMEDVEVCIAIRVVALDSLVIFLKQQLATRK
jgi:hypothetical protein